MSLEANMCPECLGISILLLTSILWSLGLHYYIRRQWQDIDEAREQRDQLMKELKAERRKVKE